MTQHPVVHQQQGT